MASPKHPDSTGANGESRGSLVVAVAGGCATALAFGLILIVFFLLSARRSRIQRTTSPGEEGVKWFHSPTDAPKRSIASAVHSPEFLFPCPSCINPLSCSSGLSLGPSHNLNTPPFPFLVQVNLSRVPKPMSSR